MQGRSRGRFAVPPCLAAPKHGPLIRWQPKRAVPGTRGPGNGGQPGQASWVAFWRGCRHAAGLPVHLPAREGTSAGLHRRGLSVSDPRSLAASARVLSPSWPLCNEYSTKGPGGSRGVRKRGKTNLNRGAPNEVWSGAGCWRQSTLALALARSGRGVALARHVSPMPAHGWQARPPDGQVGARRLHRRARLPGAM